MRLHASSTITCPPLYRCSTSTASKTRVTLQLQQQLSMTRFIRHKQQEDQICRHFASSSMRTFAKLQSNNHSNRSKNSDLNEGGGRSSSVEKSSTLGARKLFQQTPVHPSILEHIRSIGVGIAPRDTSGRNHKNRFSYNYSRENNNGYGDSRSIRKSRPLQHERQQQQTEANNQNHSPASSSDTDWTWMPPPPFGPRSLPVRVIGSVGPDAVVVDETKPTTASELSAPNSKSSSNIAPIITPPAINMSAFPKNLSQIPEIAVMGRSNVGKSTLLNALLYGNCDSANVMRSQHKQRCHVPNNMKLPKGVKAVMSNRPGETKHISFYKLQHMKEQRQEEITNDEFPTVHKQQQPQENRSLLLVDLPGYGFAYAKEKDAMAYRTLMCHYLLHRGKTLQRVLLLVDARHGMKKADFEFLRMLEDEHIQSVQSNSDKSSSRKNYTIPFPIQIVLTKCDLVSQSDLARRVTQVRQQLSDLIRREPGQLPVMLVSARPGVGFNNVDPKHHVARGGILELQKELAALAQPRMMEINHEMKVKS